MGHVLPNAQAIELVEGKFQGALTKYAELRYKPWGEDRPASDAFNETLSPSERRFTGQRAHDELGLYYYKARWYDPVLGRFVQPDSIVPESQGVQAWDRYAYVNNSPTNYADPNGHKIICGVSRGSCGSSTQSAQTIPLGEDPSKQFGAYPSLPSNTTLQSPFYDKNAEINGSFRGSIIMNFPRFTSEPSYDYDPMGNQITLPYGNWAVFGLQLIQLVGEWALPYTPPETSTVDLNLYYSLYHDGSIQFPGMSVSNNSNEIVYVATLDTITTNNRPPLWPTIVDTTRIVSPVYPGQSSIIPINSNNRFPSGYIVTNRVNINVYRYDGRLYYYKNLP